MEIINFEKITSKIVLVTGRNEYVDYLINELVQDMENDVYSLPEKNDYYRDYPEIIKGVGEVIKNRKERVAITTQSKEFIDRLLESEIDFQSVTVIFDDENKCYRCRVIDKETARRCIEEYGLELR